MKLLSMPSPSTHKYRAVLVFPVRNEELVLERSIRAACLVAEKVLPAPWLIIIAVNNSTDETLPIAKRLTDELPNVVVHASSEPGKGRAIRQSWESVAADYHFFSDVDLSVDLSEALPKMLQAFQGGADIITGSRVLPGSVVRRSLYRKIFSTGYRWMGKLLIGTHLTDLPCGCKGVNRRVVQELLPQVQNNDWFFDSELLLLGEKEDYKIIEIPVKWEEYRYSARKRQISVIHVALRYLRELLRIRIS